MITSMPRFSALVAYSKSRSGVRCAETTRVSSGTPISFRVLTACSIVSQSEDDPMITPTMGCASGGRASRPRTFALLCAFEIFFAIAVQCFEDRMRTESHLDGVSSGMTLSEPERDILRCFSMSGDPGAGVPEVAKLADEVERT